ncbi:MAG: hypothetical protein JXA96_11270 [Sedimentisphaerales bacterium]|nr:hypothetical protein [Sedimentisphaerales bacterium]
MRINTAPFSIQSQDRLNLFHIRYALLCCLSYTDQTKKLDKMLSYVLVCSFEIVRKQDAPERILDIIEMMAEIIGCDYKDDTAYNPTCILAKLDSLSRQVLYTNMTTPGAVEEPADLAFAKSKLENLLTSFDNNRLIITDKANSFLASLNKYLQQRLNEIVISLVNRF